MSISQIRQITVGIDAGSTLCKLALLSEGLETVWFPSNDLFAVRHQLGDWRPTRVLATGGGAGRLAAELTGVPLRTVNEFEAWTRGARLLASRGGIELPVSYLLVSVGTGTSVLRVHEGRGERLGGSALGGGTLLGLGRLLFGADSFEKVVDLARQGDRHRVDLMVGDIYADGAAPLHPDIVASSFGKLDSSRPEDVAQALIGMVGENVGLICAGLARLTRTPAIVYAGSTLSENQPLRTILELVTRAYGLCCHFLPEGPFCGAVGAAALAEC